MNVVSLHGVSKSYGRVRALRDVTFDVPPGVTGLLGPNGAGKSTLLLCLLGLLPDWTGHAEVLGLDARRQHLDLRRRVGYMPERDAWLPEMSAIRAVRYLGRLAGLRHADSLRRAHEVLWHVGLGEAVYRPLREYSVGMRQRFKLAQALVHDPELLFLDEPLGGLDPAGRDELLDLVRDLSRRHGKHVVWSSHILPEVEKVADHAVILHGGEVRDTLGLQALGRLLGRYAVEVEGAGERVAALWTKAGAEVETTAAPSRESHTTRHAYVVRLPAGQDVCDLLRLARLGDVRVRRVTPIREDLDTVFHRILEAEVEL